MTDRASIVRMLTAAGIEYSEDNSDVGEYHKELFPTIHSCLTINSSLVPRKDDPGRTTALGYNGFVTCWYFDAGGKLLAIANYE